MCYIIFKFKNLNIYKFSLKTKLNALWLIMLYYKAILKQELQKRYRINPNYSLRSFAKFLEVDPAILSRILSNKRALSFKVANRIIDKLKLSEKEKKLFLESVAEDFKQKKIIQNFKKHKTNIPAKENILQIDHDMFHIISDWYHYAILQLTLVENFISDTNWIAKRLGLSKLEVKQAIQRLKNVGLITEQNGKYIAKTTRIDIPNKNISSVALRKHQKQMLQKAILSIDNYSIEKIATYGLTLPIDPDKISIAKELIQKFLNTMYDVLSSGKKQKIYQITINLFPLEAEDLQIKQKTNYEYSNEANL